MKQCSICKTLNTSKWYSGPKCVKCYSKERHKKIYSENPEYFKAKTRAYRKAQPDNVKSSFLKMKYGITIEQYNKILKSQEGVCAICKLSPISKSLAVDHNHTTGQVRGLLCTFCNTGLGLFLENISNLAVAITYLEKYSK